MWFSSILVFPHTCLGWILRTSFVRGFLSYLIFLYYNRWVAHLVGCTSGNRLPMITFAFVSGDTQQALLPPPLSNSFTSAVFSDLCSWELEWHFGEIEAFELHIGTSGWILVIWDIQEIMLVTGADSFLIWKTLKYIKLEVVEQKSILYISQDWALLFSCLKSRQPPPSECSSLRISPWKMCSPAAIWEVPVWT